MNNNLHASTVAFLAAVVVCGPCGCSQLRATKDLPLTNTVVEREDNRQPLMPKQRNEAFRNAYDDGLRLAREGQYGLALGAFEAALELRPDSTDALFNLGACHESIGDPLRAVNYYRRVLDLGPDDPDCYRNLGTSFMKLYCRENSPAWRRMAYDAWRRSLQLNPNQPDVRRFLADAPKFD